MDFSTNVSVAGASSNHGNCITRAVELTQPERHFLSHWMHDSCGDFLGPFIIWYWNNRIDRDRAPSPLTELFR